MNRKNLKKMFAAYCEKFESFNQPHEKEKPFETFKWIAIKHFQQNMKLDAEDFGAVLKTLQKDMEWITDGRSVQPFNGLVTLATKHGKAEEIRQLFQELYVNDAGDLHVRRKKIYAFMEKVDELVQQYYPGSYRFRNEFNTVMAYLWMYDPENHYHLKMGIAQKLAECAEIDNDFGTYKDFNLKAYYAFCDKLVEEIKQSPELISIHNSRFEHLDWADKTEMAADQNYHILLFDLMHCADAYLLYDGIRVNDKISNLRKLAVERKRKADTAEAKYAKCLAGKQLLRDVLQPGIKMDSKAFGIVTLDSYDEPFAVISLADGSQKKMQIQTVISTGNLSVCVDGWDEMISPYREVLNNTVVATVEAEYKSAVQNLRPLLEYLD